MPPPSREALWQAGRDETVEVNQRALIDKILARYSGEHTIFRELLQNADDAGAEHVQVKFYTKEGVDAHEAGAPPSPLPDVKTANMIRYVVCNDGIPFRPEDWNRLKKIAEGNPDEEKIGAFGVGFYSLWSVCDNPFVESANKWMGFYWKDGKDQLLARSGDLTPEQLSTSTERSQTGNPWTTFTMELREPAPLEAPLDFARFLVTSITFMRTIKRIDMVVDDAKVLEVRKDIKGTNGVSRPGLNTTSTMGIMKVAAVNATTMVITARVMKWLSATGVIPPPLPPTSRIAKPTGLFAAFFGRNSAPTPEPVPTPSPSPPTDPMEVDVLAREIQMYQADVKVSVSSQFGRELERATKKAPPTRMPASLVFSREDETATAADGTAVAETKKAAAVFAGLCPPLDSEKSAKVFIGQPTSQTTGIGGHLAARFIPTVERESIDLVDRHVAQWNKELLWVGGYLSRMIYELELHDLALQWVQTSVGDPTTRAQILARGLHALKFFSFRPTTPSAAVGAEMESAFFQCSRNNSTLPLISTAGILPVDKVRMPNERLQAFLPELPVITNNTKTEASRAVDRLRERGLLLEPKFEDVVAQLGARPLTEKEMIACLSWWAAIAALDGYTTMVRSRLLDATILVTDSAKIVPLNAVKTFINPQSSSIPPDMPLPPDTIPYSVTKELRAPQMNQIFGWNELTLAHYVDYLSHPPMSDAAGANPETDIRASPIFAERLLLVLGRGWQSISAFQQDSIILTLKDVPCIPTRAGFKKPSEAYFEKNLLFDDLPTLALPKTTAIKGGLEKMLLAIGVRRTVNLQLVFSRLIGGGEWSCLDLMKYLVSVKDTLTSEELGRLKQTAAFPLLQPVSYDGTPAKIVRKKPHELYEPTDALRELGLPLLDWGENKWRPGSEEAKMLHALGLRRFPPIDTLLGIASGGSPANEKAMAYLLTNMQTHYPNFDPLEFSGVPFIPATAATGNPILAKPGEVFTNEACRILGFAVARPPASLPENAAKLRLEPNPPMDRLVSAFLHAPEKDIDRARSIFEYLGTRVGAASAISLAPLISSHWIPVKDNEKEVRLARPDEVYFREGNEGDKIYANAFTFIDFGDRANRFLRQCGVKAEPSHRDVARLLLRDPGRMLKQAGSISKYMDQLRLLAANRAMFDTSLMNAMRDTPFVLGSTLVPDKKGNKHKEWELCRAAETCIIDNSSPLGFFGEYVLAAPEEKLLEDFYQALGAKTLSSKVTAEYTPTGIRPGLSSEAKALRTHILERLTIFLSQHSAERNHQIYSVEWLSKGNNFVVREATDIEVIHTFNQNARNRHQHKEALYACAETGWGKGITLTLSLRADQDWYDVANALVRLILPRPRIDDALVLESILNTPLKALGKRGYNVDRILNQQREDDLRLKAEAETKRRAAAEAEERDSKSGKKSASTKADDGTVVPTAGNADKPPPYGDQTNFWNNTQGSIMDMVRTRLGRRPDPSIPSPTASDATGTNDDSQLKPWKHGHNESVGMPNMPGGLHQHGHPGNAGGKSTDRPTSQADIRNTVHKAVNASRPENLAQIQSTKRSVKDVSESQQAYCDESAEANLRLAWSPMRDETRPACKIWLPHDQKDFRPGQHELSVRFAQSILCPLGQVFKLPNDVLNVFWDHTGPLIAFNRNGSLFCNARYFESWHSEQLNRGQRKDALISWYFTLAHELAHNLESAHNASHEFYFSSISEEYLMGLIGLLQS